MRGIESRLAGLDDGIQNGEESGRFFANFAARMGVRWGNTAAMIAAGVAGIGGVSAR
jgi:hypothetical protein